MIPVSRLPSAELRALPLLPSVERIWFTRELSWAMLTKVGSEPLVEYETRPALQLGVTVPELRSRVIEAVVGGETFVITRNGIPVAELRPIRTNRRPTVPKAELMVLAASGPRVDLRKFRADLDRFVDQGL